jgi:HlyD family secretion protein
MATTDSVKTQGTAPWESKRNPLGKQLLRRLLPWLGGLLLLLLVGYGLWPKPLQIETGSVTRSPLTVRVSEEGKTRVKNRYIVAATVAGQMARISLKSGDEIVANETLLTTIEPAASPLLDPRARVQAQAAIAMREATRSQQLESLSALRTMATMAAGESARVGSLTRSGSISLSERERLEMDASVKMAEVRAAEFSLQVVDYEIAQARAALERPAAEGSGNLIEVKSPVSGKVLKVMQESERFVMPGSPLIEIGDPAELEIEAEILSRDAVAIGPNAAVEISQWGGEMPLKGRVRRIEPAAFTKVSALGVEEQRVMVLSDLIDPPAIAKALGDRYHVEVQVAVWHADDAVIVPAGALFREGNAWKTFVYRSGKAVLTTLEIGHSDGRFSEVIAGLTVGEEVLLHPPDTVKDGMSVKKR